MPLVEVTLSSGRSAEQVRELMAQLHAAVEASIGAPTQSIRVIVREVPPEHWSSGGITLAEKAAAALA
ncbi:2-hydroxymuconate tautomerase [uncultured Microbacterium sp.]|uniref:2-hydroxymuconate tautomerase n=1 Tax=uncultured Microbacterium sp. TaxID=191216 RepID=UPI0035C97483